MRINVDLIQISNIIKALLPKLLETKGEEKGKTVQDLKKAEPN